MSNVALHLGEAARLAALDSYQMMNTESETAFDDLVNLAARLTESPISLVTLVGQDRVMLKARHGFDLREAPREHAFCAHTILDPRKPLMIPDTTADVRFADNPLVRGAPDIRSYLGVSIVNPEGHALGSLCVLDRKPRQFDADAVDTMQTLARAVSANLELRRALLRSETAAATDPLTGLSNRRATMAALRAAVARGTTAAVIAVDLDFFKEVNDGEGHEAGDTLLQTVATRMQAAVRPGDLVGRLGGDEFVVLLIGLSNRQQAQAIAERIRATLSQPVTYRGRRLPLGATLGVAVTPQDGSDAEMVVRVADDALLRAKRDGRGGIGTAQLDDAPRLLRAAAIIRAYDESAAAEECADNGEQACARVVLQPIMALGHDDAAVEPIIGLEALARWSHPAVGDVAPAELLPLLGPQRAARLSSVIRVQALAAFAALASQGAQGRLAGTRLALNLSASEVSRADVVFRIEEQVRAAGLSLTQIEIEITEEVLLDRVSSRTLEQLVSLREQGARLVLDDFGTGTSGLAQLLRLPLDGLKLDKRFVQRLGRDVRALEIVRATISLAHGLGLQSVAEGVETQAQLDMLRELGCGAVQGYLLSRPLAPADLGKWMCGRAEHLEFLLSSLN